MEAAQQLLAQERLQRALYRTHREQWEHPHSQKETSAQTLGKMQKRESGCRAG